ncbi:hypothetical protein vseg_015331 [Gypsophila vaccaria]
MAGAHRTVKKLTTPNMDQQPLCNALPAIVEGNALELKGSLLHNLPFFLGLNGENPNKHFSEFHLVTTSVRLNRVTYDQLMLRELPFTLKDAAELWLS